jgi:hypothetical protein
MFFIVNNGSCIRYRICDLFLGRLGQLGYGHFGVETFCLHQTCHGAHWSGLHGGNYPCQVGCGGGGGSKGAPEAALVWVIYFHTWLPFSVSIVEMKNK